MVFDVESVADPELVARLRYPGQSLSPEEAVRRYRAELLAKYDTDFIPYSFQIPAALVVAKVTADFRLVDVVALDEPHFRPHVMTQLFWRGWQAYRQPTLVSFNGRSFDLPLLELAAFRYGISIPGWFETAGRFQEQPRSRYNVQAHLDLCELLTNFGSARFTGGLNLAASLLGKPGKIDIEGSMVQDLYWAGHIQQIVDYCRCDVLDTYFVFLRTRVLVGELPLDQEQNLVQEARLFLESRMEQVPAFKKYLEHWGAWHNPWASESPVEAMLPHTNP